MLQNCENNSMDKITVISTWYNEAVLAPLFLSHYAYADRIIILLDRDTDDGTEEYCKRLQQVEIRPVSIGGMDDRNKVARINELISEIEEGWVYVVDADEFMFPRYFEDVQTFLARQKEFEVVPALYFHVFRHETETDIDPEKEIIPQRIHGRFDFPFRDFFIKPSIIRAGSKVELTVGNHHFLGEHPVSQEKYAGAHWNSADISIAVRRLARKARLSRHNLIHGYGDYNFNITMEKIEAGLAESTRYPILEELVRSYDGPE